MAYVNVFYLYIIDAIEIHQFTVVGPSVLSDEHQRIVVLFSDPTADENVCDCVNCYHKIVTINYFNICRSPSGTEYNQNDEACVVQLGSKLDATCWSLVSIPCDDVVYTPLV